MSFGEFLEFRGITRITETWDSNWAPGLHARRVSSWLKNFTVPWNCEILEARHECHAGANGNPLKMSFLSLGDLFGSCLKKCRPIGDEKNRNLTYKKKKKKKYAVIPAKTVRVQGRISTQLLPSRFRVVQRTAKNVGVS